MRPDDETRHRCVTDVAESIRLHLDQLSPNDRRIAHHLLDPSTGRPAFTGVVQATALAPTALEAELRAKCAVLSGPEAAPSCLPDGGLLVLDDGTHHLIP